MNPQFDAAREKIKILQEILDSCAPAPNEEMLNRVRSICASFDVRDSYINSKLAGVQAEFERYLSVRKWASDPQGSDGVKVKILGGIHRVRDQVETIARAKSP